MKFKEKILNDIRNLKIKTDFKDLGTILVMSNGRLMSFVPHFF